MEECLVVGLLDDWGTATLCRCLRVGLTAGGEGVVVGWGED